MKTNELITKIRSVMHMVAPPARELLEQAADALEECRMHSAECRMKWIPVTERLPEPMQHIIAIGQNFPWLERQGPVLDTFVYNPDAYQPWMEHITHWMPLPEPPKEKA